MMELSAHVGLLLILRLIKVAPWISWARGYWVNILLIRMGSMVMWMINKLLSIRRIGAISLSTFMITETKEKLNKSPSVALQV